MTLSIHYLSRRGAWLLAGAFLLLCGSSGGAQVARSGTVTGRVSDARTGQPIPGATIEIDGTRIAGLSGDDGRFRLANVPAGERGITARRIGYNLVRHTVTVTAGAEASADFALEVAPVALDQVVVTGTAGGEQRRAIGNSISTIDATDALAKSEAPTLSNLLAARAPGVVVATGMSRLGAAQAIEIRGRSSLSLDNSPLLYIDGVRVNSATGQGPSAPGGFSSQNSQVGGRLNDINPDDIESIEIIKGPAAATIYGTEAANGVIQIITKKGAASDKARFDMQVQEGTLSFRDAANRMPTNYMKDASGNLVGWNGVTAEKDSGRTLFKTGLTRGYNGSVSGGRDGLSYYVSGQYENDYGIEPNNSLRQFGTHANLTTIATPQLELATSLNFVDQSAHLGVDNGASAMLGAQVGHILIFKSSRGFYPGWLPDVMQKYWDNAEGVNRFTGSETLNHRPTDWFNQRVVLGIDYTGDDSRGLERFVPAPDNVGLPGSVASGRIGQTLSHNTIVTTDYSGTATFNLTQAWNSASSVGGQFYRTELNSSTLGGTSFPGPGVELVSATANQVAATQSQTLNTTIGAYAQQQFGFRNRLFLTGAVRVDNNSAFGDKFKWVTYPKVSASWVVNEEPFWKQNKWVDALKVRTAYGESGRQPAAFAALRTFTPVQGPGGSNAVTPGSYGNPDLKPERGKEFEFGLEGGLFKRVTFDFTYWTKKTTDEIVQQNIAPSTGFSGIQYANLGQVDNHGIELQATFQAMSRPNFDWQITGNLGTNADKIVNLGGLPSLVINAGQFNVAGYPIRGIFSRKVVSATRDPATGLATNVLCADTAGLAPVACATAPFVYIGTPTPKTTGSIGNTITLFKRLRLYGLVDFRRGNRVYNATEQIRCTGLLGVGLCDANYHPQNYDILYIAETAGTATSQGYGDQYYEDGSFVKLRELSATYELPEWFHGASRSSFTLAARELHTWTNYRGLDPEESDINQAVSASTHDQGVIPPLMRVIATINVKF